MNPFEEVEALEDDWDGEGAPKPSELAMSLGKKIYGLLEAVGRKPNEVDGDVMGGLALNFYEPYLWLSINNAGLIVVCPEGLPCKGFKDLNELVAYISQVTKKDKVFTVGCKVQLDPKTSRPFETNPEGRGVGEVFALGGTAISYKGTRKMLEEHEVGVRWSNGDLNVADAHFLEKVTT